MIPYLEIALLERKVDAVVDYYMAAVEDDDDVVEQAKKVKNEIDKLSELMEQ